MANKRFFRYKRANDILSTMIDNTLTKTNKVNDFTDGSALKTLYEAVATEQEMFYYLTIENIKGGIWNSIYNAFDFGRKPELRAYGYVDIAFSAPLRGTVVIPVGTKITSSSSYYDQEYVTTEEIVLDSGTVKTQIRVVCTQGGTYGNIPNNVLDTISNVGWVSYVTNSEAFSTGQNEETDAEVRVRFREFIQALQKGTVQALQYGAKTVPNVDGAYVDESIGYVRLYAHDKNGDLPDFLQQEIQNEMLYWRPAGIPVTVLPIHKSTVDMNITVDAPNINVDKDAFAEFIRAKIINYINTFKVKQDLVHSDIVQKVMDINDMGITNSRVDLMVNPDDYLRGLLDVDERDSILLNGIHVPKSRLVPKDRSHSEDYIVSNPEDEDNNTYANLPDQSEISDNQLIKSKQIALSMKVSLMSNETTSDGEQDNGTYVYQVEMPDNTKVKVTLNKNSKVQSADIIFDSNHYLSTVKNYVNDTLTAINYVDNKVTESVVIQSQSSQDIAGYAVLNGLSQISIKEIVNDNTLPFNLYLVDTDTGKINYNMSTGETVQVTLNKVKNQKTIQVNDGKGTETITVLTLSNKLVSTTNSYKNIDGTTTTVMRDENNEIIRTIITDSNDNIISDTGTTTTTTTIRPTTSTTSTTEKPEETTSTTTTIYPFNTPKDVSAYDAPDIGFLPVFGVYRTSPNEILKSGNIIVKVNN